MHGPHCGVLDWFIHHWLMGITENGCEEIGRIRREWF